MAKKAAAPVVKMVRITQVKSAIGYSVVHKATIRALGIHRLHRDRGTSGYSHSARNALQSESPCC